MTKKDLLEAIEDMPEDAPILISQVGGLWTEFAGAMLSELSFGNLKKEVIFIKTTLKLNIC